MNVNEGDTLAHIIDPYDGTVLEDVKSPVSGVLFFSTNKPIILQNHLYQVSISCGIVYQGSII